MIKRKHFFVDVIVYGVPLIVSRGMGFILLPIYTRYLTPEDYGILEMITAFYVLLSLTLPLEISQAMARFAPEQKSTNDKIKIVSTAYWLTCMVFSVFTLVSFTFPEYLSLLLFDNTKHNTLIKIASISMLFNALFQLIQTKLRFELKAKQSALLGIVYTIFTGAVAVLLLVFYNYGIISMLIGQLVGSLLGLIFGLYFCYIDIKIRLVFDYLKLIEMLKFSTPLVFSSIGIYLGTFIDRWMLAKWLSLDDVGVYSVASKFSTVIGLLFFAFGQALVPLIYNHFKEPETPKKIDQILRLVLTVAFIALIFLSLFSLPVVHFLTGENFLQSAPLIVWLAVSVILMNLYKFAPGMDIMKKTKLIAGINLSAAFLNIIMNAILIPIYGTMGAAIATIFSAALMFALYVLFSQKEYKIHYNWQRCFGAAFITLCSVIIFTNWQFKFNYKILLFLIISSFIYKTLLKGNEIKSIRF